MLKVFFKLFLPMLFVPMLQGCVNIESLATHVLYPYSSVNRRFPTPEPPEGYEEVRFDLESEKGEKYSVHGWYYTAPKPKANTLVYLHGNGENIGALYAVGFLEKLEESDVNFIVIDYPKYGLSTGELREETFVGGAVAAVKFAREKFPDGEVIVWGRSLGAAVATLAFERTQSLADRLILTSPWTNLYDLAREKVITARHLSEEWREANAYDSATAASAIEKPVLIFHGDRDSLVPVKYGRELANHFSGQVRLVEIPNREHNDIFADQRVWKDVNDFVQ